MVELRQYKTRGRAQETAEAYGPAMPVRHNLASYSALQTDPVDSAATAAGINQKVRTQCGPFDI